MILSDCRTAIRASADLDSTNEADSPVSKDQLNAWISTSYQNLRRKLQTAFSTLYVAVGSNQVLGAGQYTLAKAADYDALIRIERLSGTRWYPIEINDELMTDLGPLAAREEGTNFQLGPISSAENGTYRIVYVQKDSTFSVSNDNSVLNVPAGFEDIIIEDVAARIRVRRDDDPTPHLQRSAAIWVEQKRMLRRRYGRHAVPGIRLIRRWW